MTRILMRAHKGPFTTAPAEKVLARNLIGKNAGNQVFSQAAFRLLSTAGTEIDARRLTNVTAEEINDGYDALVIPLANAFRISFRDQLDQLTDIISKLKVPVVILGVGVQAPMADNPRPNPALADSVTRFVRAVLDRSARIGVRGQITADWLGELGFGHEHVEVIGCPSMFMFGPDLKVTRKVDHLDATSRIAMNMSPYPHTGLLGPLSVDQAARYPHLIYLAQDHITLGLMLTGDYAVKTPLPPDLPVTLDHPLLAQNRIRFFLDPLPWMRYLSGFDFCFGTRIHGNIVGLISGVPSVLLAHDARVLELADYHQIPRKLMDEPVEHYDAARLYAETDWEPMMAGHAERWQRFQGFLADNGLRHVYLPGESGDAFDARLDAVDYPPAVEMISGRPLAELYDLQRTVKEQRQELKRLRKELIASRRHEPPKRGVLARLLGSKGMPRR